MGDEDFSRIEAGVSALEQRWPAFNADYKDILQESHVALTQTVARPALRERVLAVLASIIDELEELSTTNAAIGLYLGEVGTRAYWELAVGHRLPKGKRREFT